MDKLNILKQCEKNLEQQFNRLDEISFFNQQKVLSAFQKNKISTRHFVGTNGYGYGDMGRDTLNQLFADVFGAEKALVSPQITCGTHALSTALFGILRPYDTILSATGEVYDSMIENIRGTTEDIGSLKDYLVKYEQIDLVDGKIDLEKLKHYVAKLKPKLVYVQRSRGYSLRKAFSVSEIEKVIKIVKEISPDTFVMIDNCYGEFVEEKEPTEVGADIIVGSLIKNAGGGIAPTGGYIAGTEKAINLIEKRLTCPSLGAETGSYEQGYRMFYQGLFMAPHITMQAIKGAYLVGEVMKNRGYDIVPKSDEPCYDIIKSIIFNTSEELIKFVQLIQKNSPIDSDAVPMPWEMPGYADKVIMAAGTFVSGASIELSCDSPIREPYIAYFQGGLTYEHIKCLCLELLNNY
ncbi:MAG: methionine gamma-lyase family protein [Clostridia bacterium]|nr:methionine gamma-lyase family protein [Clostridia bacterium]